MNDLGKNLQWILEDVSNSEPDMMDGNDIEIFAEDENGMECSCDIEITELCAQAAKRIDDQKKELESKDKDLDMLETNLESINGHLESSKRMNKNLVRELEAKNKELAEARRKGFWLGFEDARCFPDESNILQRYMLLTNKSD